MVTWIKGGAIHKLERVTEIQTEECTIEKMMFVAIFIPGASIWELQIIT